jgi:hypothetical protein
MKPYQLSTKCYRWGVFCPQDFATIDEAKAGVRKPQDASLWIISEFGYTPGRGPYFIGRVATLCGSVGAVWTDEKAVQP